MNVTWMPKEAGSVDASRKRTFSPFVLDDDVERRWLPF